MKNLIILESMENSFLYVQLSLEEIICERHACTCSIYRPLRRQYSANSACGNEAVSSTTANFTAPDHCSGTAPVPPTTAPAFKASRRHAYSVASVTLNSLASIPMVSFPGAIMRCSTIAFSSLGYPTASYSSPQIQDPILDRDQRTSILTPSSLSDYLSRKMTHRFQTSRA